MAMSKRYIPDSGDIIWVHFDLPAGSDGADHKAALVLSPAAYNKKTGLVVCCAITSHIKGYPFEVTIAAQTPEASQAALSDQVKSLDWVNTKLSFQGRASAAELAQVRAKLRALILKP